MKSKSGAPMLDKGPAGKRGDAPASKLSRNSLDGLGLEALREVVYPQLMDSSAGQVTRIWVAGCATGLEVYVLVMSILEFAEQVGRRRKLQVFATDSDKAVLARARTGFYPRDVLEDYPKAWLRRWFIEEAAGYRVGGMLRDRITFARLDFIQDPPLPRMELIYCPKLPGRTTEELGRVVLPKLGYALRPNGFLCLGEPAPTLSWNGLFETVNGKSNILSRVPGVQATWRLGGLPSAQMKWYPLELPEQWAAAGLTEPQPKLGAALPDAGQALMADPWQRIAELEKELADTRSQLKTARQEFTATHESLQVHSEELSASNEELHSINEDLEEFKNRLMLSKKALEAANRQLVKRNAELDSLSSDLSNLHASLPSGIVLLDCRLRVRRFTPAARALFNLHDEDIGRGLGQLRSNLEFAQLEQFVADVMDGASLREREVQDRKGRWYSLRVRPYVTADRKIDGAVLMLVDIDALKRTQRDLQEQSGRLRDMVGELEHFSYTITHDMRAPLRAMIGFAHLARNSHEPWPRDSQEFLDRIAVAAERMDALIRDALNYSRALREELPLESVDTGTLLRGMLDTYPEFEPSKAGIHVEGPLPVVLGNAAGLTQCFSNLLSNAVKFAKPGQKPEIRVWAEQAAVPETGGAEEPKAVEAESSVRIFVEDKGIGIPKEMLPRLFQMFSRGSNKQEGTGIGLALVRKVVQRMAGRVGVESELGKGTRFWVELKSGTVQSCREEPKTVGGTGPKGGTVLYVEEEESDAAFMKMAFAGRGIESALRVVGDGRAAIEYLSGSGMYADRKAYPLPSVVLLDLNLPRVTGLEVLQWMRNQPAFARTPVVVFSCSTREGDWLKARELGAVEFVEKPGSGLEFGGVVEQLQQRWLKKRR